MQELVADWVPSGEQAFYLPDRGVRETLSRGMRLRLNQVVSGRLPSLEPATLADSYTSPMHYLSKHENTDKDGSNIWLLRSKITRECWLYAEQLLQYRRGAQSTSQGSQDFCCC